MSSDFFNTTIGEQVTLQRGFDITKKKQIVGLVPVVSSGGVASFHNEAMATGPGVILGRKGTLGTVFYINEDYWPHDTTLWVKDYKGNNPRFVYYFFLSIAEMLKKMDVGAANPTLNRNHVHPLPIIWTSRENQNDIVEVLASIDDKIELNLRINQTLKEIAQAIFKSWFADFEPVKAKIQAKANGQDPERAAMCAISGKFDDELDRLPTDQFSQLLATAALFPDELTDSEQGLIPKDWKVKKIEEVIKRFSVGKKYSQKTASKTGKVPILDQGKSGIIGYHNDEPGVKASLEDPIIVFANHTCYMRLVMHGFSAIQNVLPFKGNGLNIYWIFLATYGKQNFIEYKGHWPDFVINKIIVPNNSLDEKFGEYVACFFKEQFVNEKQASSLAELRDTLLPKLLSGEIDLQQIAV
jgi:type I restriction enzyme S subunit